MRPDLFRSWVVYNCMLNMNRKYYLCCVLSTILVTDIIFIFLNDVHQFVSKARLHI